MNLKCTKVDNVMVVNVNEIKFTNIYAADFREAVDKLIDEGNLCLLINLEKVSYMDSAGLGAIVSSFNYLTDTTVKSGDSGKIAICSLNHNVDFLFSMLRMNGIIEIYDNENIALDKMKINS